MTRECRHADRDCPRLLCGYPLPCPWHTVVIDASGNPPTVTIPVTSDAMSMSTRTILAEVAEAVARKKASKKAPKKGRKAKEPHHG